MSAFLIVHSALEGFRLTREQPKALLVWGACILAVGMVEATVMAATGGQDALGDLQQIAAQTPPDPQAGLAVMVRLAPSLLLTGALQLILFAALACSALRLLLAPGQQPALRLGRQEVRMIAAGLLLATFSFAASLLAGGPLMGLGSLVALAAPGPGSLLLFLGQAASVAAQAFVMVRLALAAPTVVAEGRIGLVQSWRLTQGRFWSMLAALLLAAALYLIVILLCSFMFMALSGFVLVAAGGDLATLPKVLSPGATLADVFLPGALAYQLFQAALLAVGVPILAGPLAAAYRALTPR